MKRRLSSLCVDPMWFYLYMNKERDYKEDVVNWMLRDESLTKGYVYVPICHSNHLNLLILCNIGERMESNTKSPFMFLLDSLHKREEDMEPTIRKFVSHLYKNGEKKEQEEVLNIPYKVPKVPQQKDASKCGYYVLYLIYRFVLDSPDDFNINKDYPGFVVEAHNVSTQIDFFLVSVEDMRLPTFDLSDLEEGGNSAKIVDCLLALKSYNEAKQGAGKDSEPFTNSFSKNMLENDSISSNLCPESDSTKMHSFEPNQPTPLVFYTPESSPEEIPLQQPTLCKIHFVAKRL
ncbi:hypothetical protein POM88_020806 [Heracleum sosnowskyi]|uniref:Ubiquitin-like protease family profile domain-containing protein n=1 Tax=Heracleum sosnowskyi TaxID=360622 RepID=A0AAD8MRT3_9APIA|nr:hypothetical protein POM88_020806 [Heracleum sosnowskyi]